MMTMDTMTTNQTETGASVDIELSTLRNYVTTFLEASAEGRTLSHKCRDYRDGKQWTDEQVKELRRRKQAPVVNNRIKTKYQGLLGLVAMRKVDPKAYPRNVDADSNTAEAATDGLTYVAEKTKLQSVKQAVAGNFFCEGYGGCIIIEQQGRNGDVDPLVEAVEWDRIFYDPYSRKDDFSDARYKGFMVWMDEEDIRDMQWPIDAEQLETALGGSDLDTDDTFEDQPTWFASQSGRRRHLVATAYFKVRNVWHVSVYTGTGVLVPPMPSPYVNEYGEPECCLELVGAYITRNGMRYGELASSLDLQDEINHRRSKALFLLSQRQTFGNRGAIKDVKKAKRELAKPDGHLEIQRGEFGKDFGVLPTGDMAQAQFELLQEAKAEIDAQSYNAQLAGQRQEGDLSGTAIRRLQRAGVVELNDLFEALASWELRVYRQMWNRMRQYWNAEKWVRISDDPDTPRWVGFNIPISMGQFLQETMDDDSKPEAMRMGASAQLIMLEKQNPAALQELVEVKNQPAELDIDIIIEQGFDSVNASEEQLEAILSWGAASQFDITDLLEISNIHGKDKLIDRIEKRRQQAAQVPDPTAELVGAKTADTVAAAKKKEAETAKTMVETQLASQPGAVGTPMKGSVNV